MSIDLDRLVVGLVAFEAIEASARQACSLSPAAVIVPIFEKKCEVEQNNAKSHLFGFS